jgi:hypothetical protein
MVSPSFVSRPAGKPVAGQAGRLRNLWHLGTGRRQLADSPTCGDKRKDNKMGATLICIGTLAAVVIVGLAVAVVIGIALAAW